MSGTGQEKEIHGGSNMCTREAHLYRPKCCLNGGKVFSVYVQTELKWFHFGPYMYFKLD